MVAVVVAVVFDVVAIVVVFVDIVVVAFVYVTPIVDRRDPRDSS